jgi:type IX secretion system PorP/SprF family membrane protein
MTKTNTMRNILHILVIIALSITTTFAQDYHLSQYDMASMYLNPALTGMYGGDKGDFKVYNDYRSQWAALGTKPFTTEYLGFDMPVHQWNKNFGVGVYLISNSAPSGYFNTMTFMGSIAYDIMSKENSNGKHYLTTGVQIGFFYKDFNANNFTYDNQYSSNLGGFDQNIPSGEDFGKTSMANLDVNYGIFYKYIDAGKSFHPFAGVSIQHVNLPNESFTSQKSNLPMRFNFHGGCDMQINEELKLVPMLLYMSEAGATEFDLGMLAYYKISNGPFQAMLGADYRAGDAAVIHAGMKYGEHIFRFSYDINTSYLSAYTGGKGAWEFSIIITGIKGQPLFAKN